MGLLRTALCEQQRTTTAGCLLQSRPPRGYSAIVIVLASDLLPEGYVKRDY